MADLSCDDSTSVGTPVPKGAARRDPRRGAIPVMREPHAVSVSALDDLRSSVPGEVVSGIQATKSDQISEGTALPFCESRSAGRFLHIGEHYECKCKLLRYHFATSPTGEGWILHKK